MNEPGTLLYQRWQRGDREYAILEALAHELITVNRACEYFAEGGEPPLVEHGPPLLPGEEFDHE